MLEDGAYIIQGFDRNLRLMTANAFEYVSQGVNKMSITDPVTRQLRRLIFASANQVELDSVGRILIPQFLREFAGLEDDAVIVGVGDAVEIWSPQVWDSQAVLMQDAESNAERFKLLDLPPGQA
jgi:MraZ protein